MAVVGAGPAGLTVAADLAKLGYQSCRLRGTARCRRRLSLWNPRVPIAKTHRSSRSQLHRKFGR